MSGVSIGEVILDHQRRVIVDALLEQWPVYWERRAREFEDARPRPGEFLGSDGLEARRAKWHELTEIARACRARAQVSPLELITPEVDAVLGESA